jgi:hypothetical protein
MKLTPENVIETFLRHYKPDEFLLRARTYDLLEGLYGAGYIVVRRTPEIEAIKKIQERQ